MKISARVSGNALDRLSRLTRFQPQRHPGRARIRADEMQFGGIARARSGIALDNNRTVPDRRFAAFGTTEKE